MDESRDFIATVMGDEMLRREGGDALWSSVQHALKPGLYRYFIQRYIYLPYIFMFLLITSHFYLRITGFTLVCTAFAAMKVLLSPY